ncbi:Protein IQ-DOMAIN 1 [Acorus gramineus]|uniref:Protein IQ-DOMAIN 1 n=1 Tax=Acorus gramineus TaxID=55184 RepID=A0AAV9AZ11_ACOGR|nr:Protein IQ-DOMAIN 1 [Acorus gramineus]
MSSGDWFKSIISLKKSKTNKSRKVKGQLGTESNQAKGNNSPQKGSDKLEYGAPSGNSGVLQMSKIIAATRIQTAIRGFMARKTLRSLKGMQKLQIHTQRDNIVKQATTTLSYIHSWSNIQSQIRARRLNMVAEGRIKLKKQESQLKLEAKLQELEMEWSGGSETMEETIARLQQREEAAVKRERAMAYAFSHQWRANSSQNQGQFVYESGKADWGWSWMERWIAVRPWETRLPAQTVSPLKIQSRLASKVSKSTNLSPRKIHSSAKPIKSNGKGTTWATDVQKTKPLMSPGVEISVSRVTDPSPVVTK